MDTKEKEILAKFDAYVKKALVNELKYRKRSNKNYSKHYVNFSDLSEKEFNEMNSKHSTIDKYPSLEFKKTVKVNEFNAGIHNELLYEALRQLKPNSYEVIILKYWEEFTENEIGNILNISQQMVNYYKKKAIQELKKRIEEMKQDDEWTEL